MSLKVAPDFSGTNVLPTQYIIGVCYMSENRKIEFDLIATGINKLKADIKSIQEEFSKVGQRKATNTKISDQLQKELLDAKKIVNQQGQAINESLGKIGGTNNSGILKFVDGYKKGIADLTLQAEKYHRLFQETGNQDYLKKYQGLVPVIQQLDREHKAFSNTLGLANKNAGLLERTLGSMKHHTGYMLSGALLGTAIGVPYASIKTLADLEQQYNQLMTVLPQMHENQYAYNQIVKESLAVAQKYGLEINSITESLRLVGRVYKDTGTAMKLTDIAAKLSIADNFNPAIANKYIESTISAFQQQGNAINFATHAMDAATAVSHNAQVSAQDLAEAHMRSASAAHATGISFDELNALIGTIVKNSGQSGALVGNGIKAIANSLHSSKAIAEFEKLGISVYKVGENGEKSFKKLTDLLLETMIKVPAVKTNLEEAFRDWAGGKYQVSRLAGLMSDPNEYIRLLGVSINSAGFTDQQIVYQMDTIIRKAEQLKVSLQSLVMTGGQSGAASYIKTWLDDATNFVKGLQQIPTQVYSVVGSMVKWTIILYGVKTAITFLEGSMVSLNALKAANVATTTAETVALTAEAGAATRAAGAMGTLGTATAAATGGFSLLLAGIIAAGTATAIYAANVGESVSKTEQLEQKAKDMISVKQQELDMNKRQVEHIGTLGSAYIQLKDQVAKVGDNEQARIKLLKIIETTEEELGKVVGESGLERIKASDDIQSAITQEQKTHSQKALAIQTSLDELRTTQRKLADDTITYCNERVNAINNEAIAFDKAADAIGEALGKIDRFMFEYYRNKTNYLNSLADGQIQDEWKIAGIVVPEGQDIAAVTDQIKKEAEEANAKAEEIKNKAVSFYANKGSTAASLGGLYVPGATGLKVGGDEVPEQDGSKKKNTAGNNLKEPADKSAELFRLQKGREVDALFKDLKRSTDDYQAALDRLNTKQDIFGVSADITDHKLSLMNNHILDLMARAMEMESLADDYTQQANDIVANNETLVNALKERKETWKSLSTQERKELLLSYRDYVQDEKTLLKLIDLADELKTKVSDLKKDATKGANDTAKTAISDAVALYDSQMRNLGYNKEYELIGLGRFSTENQQRIINQRYAVEELAFAEKRLKEIQDSPHSEEDLLKQRNHVESLKQSLDELGDKFYSIRSEYASMASDILIQNQSLSQVWGKQWNDLANDAIKALFRIQNSTPSLLGSLFNLFGGSKLPTFNLAPVTVAANAKGSIGSQQQLSWIREGNKREAIIPLEDHKERGRQLWLQSGKELGMINTPYVPYLKNPELPQQVAAASQQNQNRMTELQLERQTALMEQQNKLILALLNKPDSGGGTSVAQPIMIQQQMTMDEFNEMLAKSQAFGYRR